jgi:hypothetical protein
MGSSTQKHELPTDSYQRLLRKREKRRNLHTKVTKQSLSDYAQQDRPIMTKRSDF